MYFTASETVSDIDGSMCLLSPLNPYVKNDRSTKMIKIELCDTYAKIPNRLTEFPKMFGLLGQQKEIMPYGLYTKANIATRLCHVDEATKVLERELRGEDIPEFLDTLNTLKPLRSDGTYDIMDYAKFYCLQDTKILALGYETFRDGVRENLDVDIDDCVTLSSLAKVYLKKEGCFDGVLEISGMEAEFMRQFIIGGRVMSRNNQKVHVDDDSADFDGVSLYPSAMVRMPGFLVGLPNLLLDDQKQPGILN